MVDKKTILLVEDDSSLQGPLAERLAAEGFNVLKAQDGAAGLEAAFKDHPDLILTDIIMPKMSGLVMISELRKDAWGKNAKVIVLTNMSNLDNISEALKNEVFDYIVKSDTSLSQVVDKVKAKIAAG